MSDGSPIYPWKELLTLWSRHLLKPGVRGFFHYSDEDLEDDENVREIVMSQWLGHPPVPEAQILELESRLRRRLPPSYRQFLQVTNGLDFHQAQLLKVWPIEEVEWIAENDYLGLVDEDEEEDADEPETLLLQTKTDSSSRIASAVLRFLHRQAHGAALPIYGGLENRDELIGEIARHLPAPPAQSQTETRQE